MAIPSSAFQAQMEWLEGVASVVPLDAVLGSATGGGVTVAITFDDGYASVRDCALPVLKALDLTATVYVNTGCIDDTERRPSQPDLGHYHGERFMRWADIETLCDSKWTIGSHGVDHLDLTGTSSAVAEHQLVRSRDEIERRLRFECRHFAYTWGRSTHQLRSLVARSGYLDAAGGRHGPLRPGFDLMAFPRINVAREYSLDDFKAIVLGDWDYLGWTQRARGGVA